MSVLLFLKIYLMVKPSRIRSLYFSRTQLSVIPHDNPDYIIVSEIHQIEIEELINELITEYENFRRRGHELPSQFEALLSQLMRNREIQELAFREKYCLDYIGYIEIRENGRLFQSDQPRRLQFSWQWNDQNCREFFTETCDQILEILENNI